MWPKLLLSTTFSVTALVKHYCREKLSWSFYQKMSLWIHCMILVVLISPSFIEVVFKWGWLLVKTDCLLFMTACYLWLLVIYDCLLKLTACYLWLLVIYECLLFMTACYFLMHVFQWDTKGDDFSSLHVGFNLMDNTLAGINHQSLTSTLSISIHTAWYHFTIFNPLH